MTGVFYILFKYKAASVSIEKLPDLLGCYHIGSRFVNIKFIHSNKSYQNILLI